MFIDNVFFPSLNYFFILLIVSSDEQKFIIFTQFNLLIFFFFLCLVAFLKSCLGNFLLLMRTYCIAQEALLNALVT